MIKITTKLKNLSRILDKGIRPYINSPTGLVEITDVYKKSGPGYNLEFSDGTTFKCAENHKMFTGKDYIDAIDTELGTSFADKILTKKVPVSTQEWIDFSVKADHESYIHKGITHHNSGKSVIIYCIIRWILEIDPDARVLLIVPNVGLVNQMFGDFAEYSSHNGFDVNKNIQKLYSGQVKELTKRVLITTWQSFSKVAADKVNGPKILSLYRGVIYDECHGAKGTESQKILEKCTSASYRIGTTGTIPTGNDVKVHALVIEGFLGPSYKVITTKELIDANQASNLNIKILALKYSPDTCNLMKKAEYVDEIKWLVANETRNRLLVKLALNANGTTLLLVRNRETHAKVLYDILKAKANIPVYYLTGSVDADERERIRLVANQEDCIIVATFQVASTGLNLPKINTVIFGSPSKSAIQVLQSIGRGLRLHSKSNKTEMTLIDIIDDMRYKKKENFAYQHGLERIAIYRKEQFEMVVKEYSIES